jgi:hypothetical protein
MKVGSRASSTFSALSRRHGWHCKLDLPQAKVTLD